MATITALGGKEIGSSESGAWNCIGIRLEHDVFGNRMLLVIVPTAGN